MGWTFTHRDKGTYTDAEWFAKQFPNTIKKCKPIGSASKFGAFFWVMETDAANEPRLVPDENGKVRLAFIILTKWVKDSYNFGWKEMGEFQGVYETGMPEKLFKLLSPFKEPPKNAEDYVQNWRQRNQAWIDASKKAKGTLKDGAKVKLPAALIFRDKTQQDTFTVVKRGRKTYFRGANGGGLYRLRKDQQLSLEGVA